MFNKSLFTPYSSVSIVNFEYVIVGWDIFKKNSSWYALFSEIGAFLFLLQQKHDLGAILNTS